MGFIKPDANKEVLPKPLPGETKKEARQGRHPVNYKKKPKAAPTVEVDDFGHLKL